MTGALSLRTRLIIVILSPLLIIASIFGIWAYSDAQTRTAERFDLSLLSTALSISRDTAATGGNALSEATRDLLRDTSGGAVFYHVYAPDGIFVTGYATPPVPPSSPDGIPEQTYYDAVYHGQTVRTLRFTQTMSIAPVSGPFTFTVWQNTSLRDSFVQGRTRPTFLIIASLVGALAVVVWFGVRLGLYPLRDLEHAIAQRSTNDLSPIKRKIPDEVSGIVGRLNTLLGELGETLEAKDRFISDAAHRLRNPIAGVLSLAEAVKNAKTPEDVKTRSTDLVEAARQTSALANSLLVLERARATRQSGSQDMFDPQAILLSVADKFGASVLGRYISFTKNIPSYMAALAGDATMFEQAILNLLNNAAMHGGETLTEIALHVSSEDHSTIITVQDNGKGINEDDLRIAMARFGQVEPSAGSGLGLPICRAVVESMGGKITTQASGGLFSISMVMPHQS
jgi:two-component system sensor histidine kinase TctE